VRVENILEENRAKERGRQLGERGAGARKEGFGKE